MSKGAGISVVVPTRNRPDQLRACLATLRASLRAEDELIVADSASVDGDANRAVAEAAGAELVRCEEPGASRARNRGWRAATREVVAFVDDDVRVSPAWAAEVEGAFQRHAGAAFVTGRIGLAEGVAPVRPVALKEDPLPHAVDRAYYGCLGHSANLAVRRGVLEQVGGFDERLGAGGDFHAAEDNDLFDRILKAGHVGWYDPAVAATHEQWREERDFVRLDWGYGVGSGVRLVKLVKTMPSRVLPAARMTFWTWGLQHVIMYRRMGQPYYSGTTAVRMAGAVVGIVRALPVRVRGGHLVAPRDGWIAAAAHLIGR